MENELASLSTEELELIGDLQKLEAEVIAQLEEKIKAKKMVLSGLEIQKNDLEKKLSELQGNAVANQKLAEQCTKVETVESSQQCPAEEVTIIGVVENTPEEPTVKNKKREMRFF